MAPPKKQTHSQSSLLSFFGKKTASAPATPSSVATTPKPPSPAKSVPVKTLAESTEEVTSLAVTEPFSKSPSNALNKNEEADMDVDEEGEEEIQVPTLSRNRKKRVSYKESDSEPEEQAPRVTNPFAAGKRRKLIRRISSDDDSDEEFKPSTKDKEEDEDEFVDDAVPEFEDASMDEEEPQVKKPKKSTAVTPLMERLQKISVDGPSGKYEKPAVSLLSRLNAAAASSSTTKAEKSQDRNQKFKEKNEERYEWLKHQRDLQGNPENSPDYNPRTLLIPQSAWNKFTPFEKQYWEVKHKHWDTIVFFKKGKFYELYEKDADVGHKDFDLKMTDRVNMKMVGVPEMSFDYWAAQFIAKGHKVAKVDQMETAIGKSMREKSDAKTSKADKIIRRELTSVLTAGTLVDAGLLTNELGTYCMCIKEQCGDESLPPTFGISFVDTATAEFNLVHFEDDVHRTKFETLIMQIKPRELVTEKGRLSKTTTRLLKSILDAPLWNMLIPEIEFWDKRVTEDELECNEYWTKDDEKSRENLRKAMEAARSDSLLMSSFGGLIWYLRSLKLDRDLLSAKNISLYDPIRNATSLVLDGQTLANLEIFQNSHDGSTQGTVFKLLANSITPFGKRLFKQWLCHPLRKIEDINARLDAIEDLMRLVHFHDKMAKELAALPDLERLISRIHSGRVKVKEFLTTLNGFQTARDIIQTMIENRADIKSALLGQLIDQFPHIDDKLNGLFNSFITADVDVDYQKMKTIIPKSGCNEEWDGINEQIENIKQKFDEHLQQVKKTLKNSRITYKDLGKDLYQLEVPKSVKVPNDWIKMSQTVSVNRYWDNTVKGLVTEYKEMLETKNAYVKKFSLEVYSNFDSSYPMWLAAVQSIAQLDALMGLAKGSINLGEPACRPTFVDEERSVMEFEELRHPCVVPGVATDFIPNDIGLGGKDPSMIVLTGPNMGGKSTLLRQTCVAIILAQLGGYVPARSCRLTPCDRIYTRIGANDNIMGGQSTFMVELAETSKILREATPRSMVILDELGRGTSTFDGYAIAYAVLHYLSTHIGCLGMFATHYQTLCKEFSRNPEIINMHMGYFMDDDEHNVTFLYKLTEGICEKSFGMNVAAMAGIRKAVIERAKVIAEKTEIEHKMIDTTYRMEIDGDQSEVNVTPAIMEDLSYLLKKKRDRKSSERILKSFTKIV